MDLTYPGQSSESGRCSARVLRTCSILICCAITFVANGPVRADILEELYASAASEGELNLYAQGPPQVYSDLVQQFQGRYPKVHVRVTPGRYDVIEKIDAQLREDGRLDADLVTAQTVQHLVRWQRLGALLNYAPIEAPVIPAKYKDLSGTNFFPLSLYLIGSAYNANKVAATDAPQSIKDFLKAQFKGKIVSTYPHDDDVTLYLYFQIAEKYGWKFIEDLVTQNVKYVRSHVLVAEQTATGERPVTFDQISSFNKVKFVVPDDVPMVVFPYVIGSFAKSPHPNASKLFLNFSLSKEPQERFVRRNIWSARIDVEPPVGFKPLSSYNIASDFITFISDESRVVQLRAKFEKIVGPIAGEYISTSPPRERR